MTTMLVQDPQFSEVYGQIGEQNFYIIISIIIMFAPYFTRSEEHTQFLSECFNYY